MATISQAMTGRSALILALLGEMLAATAFFEAPVHAQDDVPVVIETLNSVSFMYVP